jgi:uncharacterized protein
MKNETLPAFPGGCGRRLQPAVLQSLQQAAGRLTIFRYMRRKEAIQKVLQEHAGELAAMGVRAVGLFGSVARGEDAPESDVDILVEFEEGAKTFRNFNRVCDLLEREIGPDFDLVTPEGLSPHIRPFILKEVEYVAIAS